VFGIDPKLDPMEVAKRSIDMVSDFLFKTLELQSTFTEIGIDDSNFTLMAKKACWDDVLPGFKPLSQQDIENIFKMCL
jgi:alcohol dehydrogenase YqhD (iron-dependent ADH family)